MLFVLRKKITSGVPRGSLVDGGPPGDFSQDGCCFPGKCHLTKQRIGAADDALAATGIYSLFNA